MAPRSEIQAQARAVSFGRGGSKRTFAMLMVSAGKSAFKARKKKKQALKSKKREARLVEAEANGGMAWGCLTS